MQAQKDCDADLQCPGNPRRVEDAPDDEARPFRLQGLICNCGKEPRMNANDGKRRNGLDSRRITSAGTGVAPEEHRHAGFVEVAPDDGQHHLGEVIFGGIEVKTVQVEKDEGRNRADALVAID